MKKYIGTKHIEAEPMTMGAAYEKGLLQAGRVPNEAEKDSPGYHVKYENGYESWSPAAPFEKAYKEADTYLQRMLIELSDLEEKIDKLTAFIASEKFEGLWSAKQSLLRSQVYIMDAYAEILKERISFEEIETNNDTCQ